MAEVSCVFGTSTDANKSAVAVVALAGADPFGDDGALGVFAQVDHLRPGIGLLVFVGHRYTVEFTDTVVAF